MHSHRYIKFVLFVFIVPLLFMSILTACESEVSERDTVVRDGVLYLKGDDDPFTGFVVGRGREDYRTQTCTFRKEYKDGVLDGVTSYWYLNGKLESTVPYKDGKTEGYMIRYWDNGKPKSRIHFKDGLRGGTRGEMFWNKSGKKVRS